jgi:hypothetical protein
MALQLPPHRSYAANPEGLVVQIIQVTLSMSAPIFLHLYWWTRSILSLQNLGQVIKVSNRRALLRNSHSNWKARVASILCAASFFAIACSGSSVVGNGVSGDNACVPKITDIKQDALKELFNSMFFDGSAIFEPIFSKNGELPSNQNANFSYTPKDRGWFAAIGVSDVVVRALPKDRSVGSAYYDQSPFFSASRHDNFIDVESEIDPLAEDMPAGLKGIMFTVPMANGQEFDEIFRKYQARNKWLSGSSIEVDQLDRVCAVSIFREKSAIRHVAMIVNSSSSSAELLRDSIYLPGICARRMNAILAGFQGIKAGRLFELNKVALANGTRNERIFGLPDSWVVSIRKLSSASGLPRSARVELCQSLSSR